MSQDLSTAKQNDSVENFILDATVLANALSGIIEKQKLYSVIKGGKKYVRCEGWTTLAALKGCIPREVGVELRSDGAFVATVELVRMDDGMILSRASAECGLDEKTWADRNSYARRSMAITRATSKVCRIGFSWVMTLAGYEATPEEEILDLVKEAIPSVPTMPMISVVAIDPFMSELSALATKHRLTISIIQKWVNEKASAKKGSQVVVDLPRLGEGGRKKLFEAILAGEIQGEPPYDIVAAEQLMTVAMESKTEDSLEVVKQQLSSCIKKNGLTRSIVQSWVNERATEKNNGVSKEIDLSTLGIKQLKWIIAQIESKLVSLDSDKSKEVTHSLASTPIDSQRRVFETLVKANEFVDEEVLRIYSEKQQRLYAKEVPTILNDLTLQQLKGVIKMLNERSVFNPGHPVGWVANGYEVDETITLEDFSTFYSDPKYNLTQEKVGAWVNKRERTAVNLKVACQSYLAQLASYIVSNLVH